MLSPLIKMKIHILYIINENSYIINENYNENYNEYYKWKL